MNVLIRRNVKLYFRDRSAVFFSLLAVIIIIGLYALFLGGVWIPSSLKGIPSVDYLMNSWLMAGLLSVVSVTTTMGAFGIMIDDKTRRIDRDFFASPVKRSGIAAGYIGSSFLIGVIMSLITAVLAELYITSKGGGWLPAVSLLRVFGLILLATLTNTSMVCFLVSFFNSQNSFGTASTVIGTLIGFLTGIYLPIGELPASVQTVIKLFPPSHAALLFRQVMVEAPMKTAFAGAPYDMVREFKEYMGIEFSVGGQELAPWVSAVVLLVSAVVFYGLSVLNLSRKKKD
ncbi:ABC transporter permease [Caproicibacter sp.]|uniref:ABC transporter permease n=1 Tax=Caproicibacter sp. TaxID=2814884 RepID=UPI003989B6AF